MSNPPNETPAPARASREFNLAVLVIGPPQYGKTTVVRKLVVEHLQGHPTGLAFVHDPNLQFRGICETYEDVGAWRRAYDAATKSKAKFPRGASIGGEWAEVRDLAVSIGRARNRADNVRVPILLASDESSLMIDSGRSHVSKDEVRLLSNRRHWGIAPVYNAQQATSLVDTFYALATRVICFAQASTKETEKVEQRCGLPEGSLSSLVNAPKRRYVEWRAGEGLV